MSTQCKGITKSGTRCRNIGDFENGYCRLHAAQSEERESSRESNGGGTLDEKREARGAMSCTCDPKKCLAIMALVALLVLVVFLIIRKNGSDD